MIKLLKFYQEIRTGSSLPLIVGGSDGLKYVVKPRGSGDGVVANVVEWLAVQLGRLMHLPILNPELLLVEAGLAEEAQDPEIRELLERSVGVNFGTRFLEQASVFRESNRAEVNDFLKNNIFLYDLFLLNIDRNSKNTNLIFQDDQLWCLDYSSSITLRSLLAGRPFQQEEVFLKEIKKHPFYNPQIYAHTFIERFTSLSDQSLGDLVDELPEEWVGQLDSGQEPRATRNRLSERLIEKKNGAESLTQKLEVLKSLEIETEAERKARVLKNKQAFVEKFGKL